MNTHNAGGGEILKYWGQNNSDGPSYLDEQLIRQFLLLPVAKIVIVLLLITLAILIILRLLQVKSPFKGRAITTELEHMDRVKKRDDSIVRANNFIQSITKIIEHTPLALNKSYTEYWNYNLTRANIRIPGGFRTMKPEEFNALISFGEIVCALVGILIAVLFNVPFGTMLIICGFVFGSIIPMQMVRGMVKEKDNEIIANFADFYLMIHDVLLASANTPISGIMKSYDKTTNSDEMHRFVDVCIHYIDTYGEYEATRHIARQYREIAEVNKLMRLIRQSNEGGDIRSELMAFRNELLEAKKYAIEVRMNKLVARANASFNILMPILVQAILSAMAIYLDDITSAGSFL